MSRLRILLGAGVCSIALGGCIPAAAGLALAAADLVTGGGSSNANGFRNPIDRQSTGRQVKEALSRLDDSVDPGCQAMLDEQRNATGGAPAGTEDANGGAAPREEPRNLLAKVEPAPDVARSAESATSTGADAAKPIKVALAPAEKAAPGQCEHRLVCLPGTPKPTIMLMCPGKDPGGKGAPTTAAADAPEKTNAETGAAGGSGAAQETATAAAEPAPAAGYVRPPSPENRRATTRAPAAEAAPASLAPAPTPAPSQTPAPPHGLADWNWAYDPAKQL